MEQVQGYTQQLIELGTVYGLRVVGVFVFMFVAWIFAGWAGRSISKQLQRAKFDATLAKFFGKAARWGIIVLAVIGGMGVFDIQTASFAAVLAAMGLAVGLALQGTLSNFASGVMLLMFRPFNVGDWITVAGHNGTVDEIGLFVTSLDTADNRRVILPNSEIFGNTIENWTHHEARRVDINVGTDYPADLDQVRSVLEKAAAGVPGQHEDYPAQVFLSDLGDSSINWQVRVWCKPQPGSYWAVWQATTLAVKKALDEADIGIPFPQMDVHLDGRLSD